MRFSIRTLAKHHLRVSVFVCLLHSRKKKKETAMLSRACELINDDYHSFLLVSLKLLVSGSPAVVLNANLPIVSLIRFLNLLMSGTAQEMATAAIVCSEVARDAPETFPQGFGDLQLHFLRCQPCPVRPGLHRGGR